MENLMKTILSAEGYTVQKTNDALERVQLCIVHMVRNSLRYVSYKDRKAFNEAGKHNLSFFILWL